MEHILGPPIPLSAFPSLFSSYIDTSDKTKRKSIVITTSRMRVSKHRYIRLFVAPWTVARQASLSMELPRQEYWSGLPFPSLVYLAYQILIGYTVCKYFPSFLSSPITLLIVHRNFWCKEIFSFREVPFICFFLCCLCFWCYS